MSIDVTFFSILVVSSLAYIGLLLYILRLDEPVGAERWMALYCLWSVAVAGALALSATQTRLLNIGPGLWLALASLSSVCLLGGLTFAYIEVPHASVWFIAIPVAMGFVIVGDLRLDPASGLAEGTWLEAIAVPGGWLARAVSAAYGAAAVGLVSLTYISVTRAGLPLLANRRFWWVITLIIIFAGEAISIWGTWPAGVLAQGLRLVGVGLAVYASTHLELVDIRGLVRRIVGNALYVLVTALFIIIGIVAASYLLVSLSTLAAQIAIVALALALAIVYQQLQPAVLDMVNRAVLATGYDAAQVVKGYSNRIANIIDLGELAVAAGLTTAQAVQATRVGLLVLTPGDSHTTADVLIGGGKMPTQPYTFANNSPFLQTLTITRHPLSQYAVDYDPRCRAISAEERAWLRSLGADSYVPIFDDKTLSAVLAIGPRASGDPYRRAELDLLISIANQSAVALKNARLVTNLRLLNEETRRLYDNTQTLNRELAAINERMRQMDKVKSDFISIASHELRTPLTKIKGFSDIMNEIAGEGNSNPAMLKMTSSQISKACIRLEELISQMLDVSQIDISGLALVYAHISLEQAVWLALKSYDQPLKERKLSVVTHDIEFMPTLEADSQRLVQVFRQLIGNAIKFTPDGGRIDIYAYHLPANEERDRPEAIEVVVADTGVGINPEHFELIFEKFYRVGSLNLHSTGDTKFMGAGPGLGLTVARGIVESHGGRIWVESPGFDPVKCPGSRFHVLLPVQRQPSPVDSALSPEPA